MLWFIWLISLFLPSPERGGVESRGGFRSMVSGESRKAPNASSFERSFLSGVEVFCSAIVFGREVGARWSGVGGESHGLARGFARAFRR